MKAIQIETHISHQDCAQAETWRKARVTSGFPSFEPILHERYNSNHIYLKCEACGTVIGHSTGSVTDVEST